MREKLASKLEKLRIALAVPGAFSARLRGCYFETYESLKHLRHLGAMPMTFIDVGASTGVFAKTVHTVFPGAVIYSFEPLVDLYEELRIVAAKIPNMQAFNFAASSKSGEEMMYRNEYHYSSSMLPMSDLHKEAFPHTRNSIPHKVRTATLDSAIEGSKLRSPVFMKIDVQGYELEVLAGAIELLKNVDVLVCEVSFSKLYDSQPLFEQVYDYLRSHGFGFKGQIGELRHPITSTLLQIDAVFTR